jgi:tRNA(Arg) A34 adenosine deaminase TadA
MTNFTTFMPLALEQAKKAATRGEVPVGAVIVLNGVLLASAGNRTRELNDPTAHAEILAIRDACSKLGVDRLIGASIYVTLEPCPMCAAAISNARIAKLFYGANDKKSGGVCQGPRIFSHSQCHHKPDIYDGISEAECAALLHEFFKDKRR